MLVIKTSVSLLDGQLGKLTESRQELEKPFTARKDKPECLICGSDVAVMGGKNRTQKQDDDYGQLNAAEAELMRCLCHSCV